MKPKDIQIGQKFGRLTVVGFAGKDRKANKLFFVSCDCGGRPSFVVYGSGLVSGAKSCGCVRSEKLRGRQTTHGRSGTQEHKIWENMHQRCRNPKATKYEIYGGRGIRVCDRWKDFATFYEDVGPRPSKDHSIDRIDNDGNYEPGNVRWATRKEQEANKRFYIRVNPKPPKSTETPKVF